jgi:regulator of RNase E activity RraA
MTPGVTLLPGDWVVKGPKTHVVVIYDGNTSQVIDVSSKDSKNQTTLRPKNLQEYKRIIRVVDKKKNN